MNMLEKLSLDGRVAVVTGGGGGLGTAMCLALAKAGADIVVTDFRVEDGEKTAAKVVAAGRKAVLFPADITKSDQVNDMMTKAINQWGKVDILVNCAGIVREEVPKPFWEISDFEWHRGIDTNLTGAFYCSRAVAKHMVDRQYGKIINIASGFGMRGRRGSFMYNVAKAGVILFTMSLALTLAQYGVKVNAIAPGLFQTLGPNDRYDAVASFIPMGRAGQPSEIGALAVYLASDASDYATGEVFSIDGGALFSGYAPIDYIPVIPLNK
jgi:NAD(P)-dependent dehydrogenase (short-subunit alcohol dehydrogenase family)